ncbi:MAG TPA: MFS transporter, partial [Pelomicrobium sp.]|nr:MFS transporter [Pelomicrobium sp.]
MAARRFGPFFATQFLGALNDNVYKNALLVLMAYQTARFTTLDADTAVNLAAGLFVLPFFLFSATAGQLADKYDKARLIRVTKLMEIAIMLAAAAGFWLQSSAVLIGALFFMGLQSALFSPAKYALIPQHLRPAELVGGNALVETGTFVAILIGTVIGGALAGFGEAGIAAVSAAVVVLAIAGWVASLRIPPAPAPAPDLRVDWNFLTQTWQAFALARQRRTVLLSILGNSWFWFYGALVLTQIPNYTKIVLGGTEGVVTLLLCALTVGIAAGSLACERLSAHKLELGLVPFGSIGLTVFGVDLAFAGPESAQSGVTLAGFLATAAGWRVLADFLLIGLFGGFYIVPLYAIIQARSDEATRARVISANNILNALFMVLAAVVAAA